MINILDIEASGFGSSSYPIEVGVVLSDGSQYCSLIHPEEDWQHWDESAEKVHQISRSMILQHGRPPIEIAIKLNQLIGSNTIYSDCRGLDQPWLSRLFSAACIEQSFRLSDLQYVLKESQMEIWHEVKKQVASELLLDRHRASSDAKIIQLTYIRSRELCQSASSNTPEKY